MAEYRRHIRRAEWEQIARKREEAEKNKKKRKYRKRRPTLQRYCEKKPQYAHLLEEWDYEKNEDLAPDKIKAHTQQKVWWKCQKGHSWNTMVMHRTRINGTGCPYCAGHLPVVGETDLAAVNPVLAKEWNYKKNSSLIPQNFTAHARAKVWWKCQKGHEWQATINDRSNGSGCPVCYKMKPRFRSVLSHPVFEKEWNYLKNIGYDPENMTISSSEKVWWICAKGHEWQATIVSRAAGAGCPYCKGKRVIPGETDLTTTHPEIANQWNYNKNTDLTPQQVSAGSGKKVWWICPKGHEWQATVNSRKQGRGCPVCAGKKPARGKNRTEK